MLVIRSLLVQLVPSAYLPATAAITLDFTILQRAQNVPRADGIKIEAWSRVIAAVVGKFFFSYHPLLDNSELVGGL